MLFALLQSFIAEKYIQGECKYLKKKSLERTKLIYLFLKISA